MSKKKDNRLFKAGLYVAILERDGDKVELPDHVKEWQKGHPIRFLITVEVLLDEITTEMANNIRKRPFIEDLGDITTTELQDIVTKPETIIYEIYGKEGEIDKGLTRIAMHTVTQLFGDSKQLSLFSDSKIEDFTSSTGLIINNRPESYGMVLNQSQRRVLDGILKAFSDTNYTGDDQIERREALKEIYKDTRSSALTLIEGEGAPYRNIDTIPLVRLTQAQIIELSGYDLKAQNQSDKQHVTEAISFLATKQFCFYWLRSKTENGQIVKDKSGKYIKEEVMEVGTLFRIKTIRNEAGELQYYEISPSAPLLDQVNSYFLLFPNNWREEVRALTGKRASRYTYEFLFWLRVQYEQIRRYNTYRGKRKPKPFKITKRWEDIAIALKMPETMYKANRKQAAKRIQDAYSVAIKLGYLKKVENNGATDTLFLNENYYPKPGELS